MNEEKIAFEDWNLADDIETKEDVAGTLEAVIDEMSEIAATYAQHTWT